MPKLPSGVKRVIYKEIVKGDLRKFRAESNDAATGGGARDLRFRPYDVFEDVFKKMFPKKRNAVRKRKGQQVSVPLIVGTFHWNEGKTEHTKEALFETPTDARPNEGRLPVVHKYPPLNRLPPTNEGRMVLLLVQRDDDSVWPHFVTEKALRSGNWHNQVAQPILKCLEAKRSKRSVARGYLDFETQSAYSDA